MQEHGSFEMEIKNQTIIVRGYDSWNLETTLRFVQEFKLLAQTLENKPWACLVDLTKFNSGVPDVWKKIDEVNSWANSHGQKYEVVVCNSSLQEFLLMRSHAPLVGVETKFCENLEQANEWLTKLGVIKI